MPVQPHPPPPQGPPLLLTKRLIAFLNTTLTTTLTTSFLATPSGKLLAHASVDPTATTASLRTRATVAALLWDIHAGSSSPAADATAEGSRRAAIAAQAGAESKKPTTITVQLERAVVVVRRLICGIFYVAMGPLDVPASIPIGHAPALPYPAHKEGGATGGISGQELGSSPADSHTHGHEGSDIGVEQAQQQATSTSPRPAPTILEPLLPTFPAPPSHTHTQHMHPHSHVHGHIGFNSPGGGGAGGHLAVGSPTESVISAGASSITSIGAQGAVTLRRQAEDVAQKLDVKLGTLKVPGERIGVEFTRQ